MKHLGDISNINGAEAPPVDVIIGGSPCQDLSMAGRRAGLAGERSGLFMEQIRIVKEMREEDRKHGRTGDAIRPRYMVWENVPGAFSSNGGKDFQAVLTEIIRIEDPEAPPVPLPQKGKWPLADAYYGDGYSVAFRVLDAQFWGVPQRRRRIALVADFGGWSAGEILFERKGLRGDFETSGAERESIAERAGGSTKATNRAGDCLTPWDTQSRRVYSDEGVFPALDSREKSGQNQQLVFAKSYDIGEASLRNPSEYTEVSPTLTARCWTGGNNVPAVVYDARGNEDEEICPTLTGDHENRVTDYIAIAMEPVPYLLKMRAGCEGGGKGPLVQVDKSATLATSNDQYLFQPAYCLQGNMVDRETGQNGNGVNEDISYTLNGADRHAVACAIQGFGEYIESEKGGPKYIVRRLTPIECERLQGFPDGWTDIGAWRDNKGKEHKEASDSRRYKALGNSIALPPWKWVLKRISAQYERDATMGSLFDGIAGFPYLWEQLNGKGSCLWASEIDPFAIQVSERRMNGG